LLRTFPARGDSTLAAGTDGGAPRRRGRRVLVRLRPVRAGGFAAAALIGLGASIAWPSADALLATIVDERDRSPAFALRHGTMSLGFGLGAVEAAGSSSSTRYAASRSSHVDAATED
jgi:hypothetical protein